MHPFIAAELDGALACTIDAKRCGPIKLPAKPAWLRAAHCRRALRAAGVNAVVIWNRTARIGYVLDALGEERCVHWEHGAAWDDGHERDRARYLARVPRAIANSAAAARYLQLRWDYRGALTVCRNALRPRLTPAAPMRKAFPSGRPIRLGVAARLYPVKAVVLAVHALKALREGGVDAELDIAGAGPDAPHLRSLAASLGVAGACRLHGARADMPAFFASVDALVHPPLTEAFGLVALEAAAHGCPVIAASVDGLPEAVADGVTGICVVPELSLADYRGLGGSLAGVPSRVYDPASDSLREPRAVAPARLAAAVRRLFADATSYEALSRGASEHVIATSDFRAHVAQVMGIVAAVPGAGA